MAKLKDYTTATVQEYKESGVKSPNSSREMMVKIPLVEHPQLKGLYEAVDIDPITKDIWTGWVEYVEIKERPTPPVVVETQPIQKDLDRIDYDKKLNQLRNKLELSRAGVFSEEELGIPALRDELKALYLSINTGV